MFSMSVAAVGACVTIQGPDGTRQTFVIDESGDFFGISVHPPESGMATRVIGLRRRKRAASIPEAARRACCSAADVLDLIFGGRIQPMRSRSGKSYLAIQVYVDQVIECVRRAETGLSLRQVAGILHVSDRVATALIAAKHLPSYIAPNPINRCPQTLVQPAAVGEHPGAPTQAISRSTSQGMEAAGARPALDPVLIGARFYKLTELARCAGLSA
jgi:hypothetical protein